MKKTVVLVVLTLLIMAAVPVLARGAAIARVRDRIAAASSDGASGDGNITSPGETRYERCVRLATDNTGIREPEKVCESIINRGRKCVEVLEENDVENPVLKCTRLGLYVAAQVREINQERKEALVQLRSEVRERLGQQVRHVVAEHRIERVARIQENHPKASEFLRGLPEEKQKLFLHLGREKQKQLLEMEEDDAGQELNRFRLKKVNRGMLFKNRVIAKEKIRNARLKYNEAKDSYLEAKNELKDARKAFEDAKKAGDTELAMEKAKEYLILAADIEIAALEKIQGKVEASEELSEEEAAEILADIEEKMADIEEAKAAVEAATTKEEVQDAAQRILRYGKAIEVRFVVHVARIAWRQTGIVIDRGANLEERFDCALSALEEQGIDTTSIQTMIEEYSAHIESARDHHAQAKEKWQEARSLWKSENASREEIRALARGAHDDLKEARQELREAYALLKDILKEVRASGGTLGACAARDADLEDDEEIVVEEVEDGSNGEESEGVAVQEGPSEEETPVVILCTEYPSNPECTCEEGYGRVEVEPPTALEVTGYWSCQLATAIA